MGGGGDRVTEELEDGKVVMGIMMMGRRKVTPIWANDPMCRHG